MPGTRQNHRFRVVIDKQKFTDILYPKFYQDFFQEWKAKYGIDMKSSKSFMHLVNNRNEWKLLYAMTICDMLGVAIDELFYLEESEGS